MTQHINPNPVAPQMDETPMDAMESTVPTVPTVPECRLEIVLSADTITSELQMPKSQMSSEVAIAVTVSMSFAALMTGGRLLLEASKDNLINIPHGIIESIEGMLDTLSLHGIDQSKTTPH